MTGRPADWPSETRRIHRVADMLCTAHADLRDRFARRALALDLGILALAAWLVALAFVDPRINLSLAPLGMDPQIWTGLLAVGTFFLSLLQLKVDWKGRSDAHQRSLDIYGDVKREAGYLLSSTEGLDEQACRRVINRYEMAAVISVPIPEREFIQQKQRHKMKIALSKHLDDHPFSSITLTRLKFWLRDNFDRKADNASGS